MYQSNLPIFRDSEVLGKPMNLLCHSFYSLSYHIGNVLKQPQSLQQLSQDVNFPRIFVLKILHKLKPHKIFLLLCYTDSVHLTFQLFSFLFCTSLLLTSSRIHAITFLRYKEHFIIFSSSVGILVMNSLSVCFSGNFSVSPLTIY